MTTDVMIKLPESGPGFEVTVLWLDWQGHIMTARRKSFALPFVAARLDMYVSDCGSWPTLSVGEIHEINRVRTLTTGPQGR